MAATLTWKTGDFDPYTRDQASMFKKLAFAFLGVGSAAESATARAEILDRPDFTAEVQATTDTSNVQAVDLTDEGVTFPANTIREIRLKSYCMTDNDTYYYESVEQVLGGTTPVLLGQKIVTGWGEEAGSAKEYGRVHLSATVTALTTITVNYASNGIVMADIVNGDSDLALPKNRLCLVKGTNVSSVPSATIGGRYVSVNPHTGAGAGTDAVQWIQETTATVATSANPQIGGIVDLAFELWPPHNHRLVMNSNNVEVQCTAVDAIGDDNLRHQVEVYVGRARQRSYSAV